MLSLTSTLIAEGIGLLARVATIQWGSSGPLRVLSGTFLFVAVLAGAVTLLLTPLAIKLRPDPPPRAIVVLAIVAGCVPILTVLLLTLR